ncbi:class I SAM-dependent methyltransferase [Candidatus Micrarchaeota archaeon]|nr:class I SAM-dependent methyltransferase [Candidatus Micrarchaeota archaeon]
METKISEQELLRRLVRPHHHVLVNGPGLDVFHDPASVQLCMNVKKARNGKVTLLDPQILNPNLRKRYVNHLIRRVGKVGTVQAARLYQRALDLERFPYSRFVYGGVDYYKKTLRQRLRQLNPKFLQQTRIEAHPADILNSGLDDSSVDVIVDRGTHDFVIRRSPKNAAITREMMSRLRALAKEYRRVLREGGKAVLMFESDQDNSVATTMREKMAHTFGKMGMNVQHIELNDEPYRFRSNPVNSMYNYPVALVVTKTRRLNQ